MKKKFFKKNETLKIAQHPNFIGTDTTTKLLNYRISRLEIARRYEAKRKANGGKPLRSNQIKKLKLQNFAFASLALIFLTIAIFK